MSYQRLKALILDPVDTRVHTRCLALGSVAVGFAALVAYALTMPPGLTWSHEGADGGDLISAAYVLGVPHPPGYPLFVLVGHLVARFPLGPTEIALRFNILSAVAAAATAAVLAWTVARKNSLLIGLVTGLVLAFGPVYWSQAIIAEVYAVNILVVSLMTVLLMDQQPRWGWVGLLWGISWVSHLSSVLFLPLIVARFFETTVGWRSRIGRLLLGWTAGLVLYVLPAVLAVSQPPINWGNPTNLERWWWLVSARLYDAYVFGLPLADWPGRISSLAQLALQNLTLPGLLLGAWGMVRLILNDRARGLGVLGTMVSFAIYTLGYNTGDSYVLLLPALMLGAVMVGEGTAELGRLLSRGRVLTWAVLLIPALLLVVGWSRADRSSDHEAALFAQETIRTVPSQALVYTETDRHTFALWYARFVVRARPDVTIIDRGLLGYPWYDEMLRAQDPGWPPPPGTRPICQVSRQGQLSCEP